MGKRGTAPPLSDFEARLERARKGSRFDRAGGPRGEASALSRAWLVALELVTAIVVSTAIGWFFDGLFDTRPFLLLVFFFLGVGAGLLNVFHGAQRMEREARRASSPDNKADGGDGSD